MLLRGSYATDILGILLAALQAAPSSHHFCDNTSAN